MAFPRAPLKRFNEVQDKNPGVGAYNLFKENSGKDKTGSLARINETVRNCRDKALLAAEKGTLPKHIEEIHAKLAKAEERIVDLEILKISWDKQRELTEKEKGELRQKLTKLETVQEKLDRTENVKLELEEQIKSHSKEKERLKQQMQELHLKDMELEKIRDNLEEEKLQLTTELESLKKMYSESQIMAGKQNDEIVCLKKNVSDMQNELLSLKEESELLKVIKEKKSHEFENEKKSLTTQVESLISKCAEWEDKYTRTSEASAKEIGALLEANVQKVCEIEEKKRVVENLEIKCQKDLEQMKEQEEQLRGRMLQQEENELKLKKQSTELSKDLSKCEEEKRQLEEEIVCLKHNLNISHCELISLKEEFELLKMHKEQKNQEFENEKTILMDQIESLTSKCVEWEDKCTETSIAGAKEIGVLLEENVRKASEIEEKNRMLQNLEMKYEKELEQMKEQEELLQGWMQELEENGLQLKKESVELSKDLSSCVEEKKQLEYDVLCLKKNASTMQSDLKSLKEESELLRVNKEKNSQDFENEKTILTTQVQHLNSKCAEWEDKYTRTSEASAHKIEVLREENVQKTCELEEMKRVLEKLEVKNGKDLEQVKEQEELLKGKVLQLEENELQLKRESSELSKDLSLCKVEKSQLEDENIALTQTVEQAQERIENLSKHLADVQNKLDILKQEKEHDSCLQEEIESLTSQVESLNIKCDEWELKSKTAFEKHALEIEALQEANAEEIIEIKSAYEALDQKENIHLQAKFEEILSANENLTQYLTQMEKDMESLREESDQEIEGLNTIISEMSEKIEQFECERAELLKELDEDWKEKYEDLVRRMEPFKEVLDGFELERQLLHDRDKFTSEQLEKLTQECIKNMGHQNHKQRIKYLDKIKQENLNLFKTVHELQELNRRQEATIKKLKEKSMDKTETSKKIWQKAPLKEGNRL